MASEEHPRIARIAALEQKLASRKGKAGYERNCEEIEAKIANLKRAQELDQ